MFKAFCKPLERKSANQSGMPSNPSKKPFTALAILSAKPCLFKGMAERGPRKADEAATAWITGVPVPKA